MIHFTCAKCKREFSVDNSLAGKTGKCSWCGAPVQIPQPYAEGTVTDEEHDPRLDEEERAPAADDAELDIRRPGHDHYSPFAGDNAVRNWLICLAIIIGLNVILIPLTGWAIIPR